MRPLVPSRSPKVDKTFVPDRDVVLLVGDDEITVLTAAVDETGDVFCINRHEAVNKAIGTQVPDEDEYMYFGGKAYMREGQPVAIIERGDPFLRWKMIYRHLGYKRCCLDCRACPCPCRVKVPA